MATEHGAAEALPIHRGLMQFCPGEHAVCRTLDGVTTPKLPGGGHELRQIRQIRDQGLPRPTRSSVSDTTLRDEAPDGTQSGKETEESPQMLLSKTARSISRTASPLDEAMLLEELRSQGCHNLRVASVDQRRPGPE
jgi:hypothetical protein